MSLKRVNKELEYFFQKKYVTLVVKNEYNFYNSIKINTFMCKNYNTEENLHIKIEKDDKILIEYRVPVSYTHLTLPTILLV